MLYPDPERRRHRALQTINTEYHLRDRLCVAVRDLWSGRWLEAHPVIGLQLFGALKPRRRGRGYRPLAEAAVDALLWFENGGNDVLTSRVTEITRPPKSALKHYHST